MHLHHMKLKYPQNAHTLRRIKETECVLLLCVLRWDCECVPTDICMHWLLPYSSHFRYVLVRGIPGPKELTTRQPAQCQSKLIND